VYIQNRGVNKGRSSDIKNLTYKNMPRFDRTGPLGQGPATGRGMGPCGGGMGWGRGYGPGVGRRFYTKKEEAEGLKDEVVALENELKAVKERLTEIKGQN